MRHPRKRRPVRSHRWEGYVSDLGPDAFTAILRADGHDFPDIAADFPRQVLPDAAEGLRITWYLHRRGRKVRSVLRAKRFRPLTGQEVAEIEELAKQRAGWLTAATGGGQP